MGCEAGNRDRHLVIDRTKDVVDADALWDTGSLVKNHNHLVAVETLFDDVEEAGHGQLFGVCRCIISAAVGKRRHADNLPVSDHDFKRSKIRRHTETGPADGDGV